MGSRCCSQDDAANVEPTTSWKEESWSFTDCSNGNLEIENPSHVPTPTTTGTPKGMSICSDCELHDSPQTPNASRLAGSPSPHLPPPAPTPSVAEQTSLSANQDTKVGLAGSASEPPQSSVPSSQPLLASSSPPVAEQIQDTTHGLASKSSEAPQPAASSCQPVQPSSEPPAAEQIQEGAPKAASLAKAKAKAGESRSDGTKEGAPKAASKAKAKPKVAQKKAGESRGDGTKAAPPAINVPEVSKFEKGAEVSPTRRQSCAGLPPPPLPPPAEPPTDN